MNNLPEVIFSKVECFLKADELSSLMTACGRTCNRDHELLLSLFDNASFRKRISCCSTTEPVFSFERAWCLVQYNVKEVKDEAHQRSNIKSHHTRFTFFKDVLYESAESLFKSRYQFMKYDKKQFIKCRNCFFGCLVLVVLLQTTSIVPLLKHEFMELYKVGNSGLFQNITDCELKHMIRFHHVMRIAHTFMPARKNKHTILKVGEILEGSGVKYSLTTAHPRDDTKRRIAIYENVYGESSKPIPRSKLSSFVIYEKLRPEAAGECIKRHDEMITPEASSAWLKRKYTMKQEERSRICVQHVPLLKVTSEKTTHDATYASCMKRKCTMTQMEQCGTAT